jgi:hypothetical protein
MMISQAKADTELSEFQAQLRRNAQERERADDDSAESHHVAPVTGNAQTYRKAAEILKALNAGAPLESLEIPDGIVIDPTPAQLAQLNQQLRPLGIKPPSKIPKNGWRSPIFLSAARKGQAHFTDPVKESAVAGCIASGLFDKISADDLIPAAAFVEPHWQTIYAAAYSLLRKGETVCLESVNDFIAFHGHDREIQQFVGNTLPWQNWPDFADGSLALSSASRLKYSLTELARLFRERCADAVADQIKNREIPLADAHKALGELVHQAAGRNGANDGKFTMMTVEQILAYEDNPDDILLSNGYLERGSPCVLCGPPGIGKSRLALQLAVKSILGQEFLDWETNARGLKWAFLQNENGLRRLKADLRAMCKSLSSPQMEALVKNLLIHAIVNDWDGDLDLGDVDARKRVVEVIQDWKPDIVVGDPLTAFGTGDLNADQDMLRTARDFGRIVREGDPRRIPFLLHHARTGKEAKAGVAGADRSSYARNSKALYGWTRAQFNMAPVDKDNNDRLLFASGKCNNAPEFAKFIIALELDSMFYAKTDDDPDAAMEEMQGQGGKFAQKFHRKQILILMSAVTPRPRKDIKKEIVDRIHMSGRTFDTLWAELKEFEEIEETGDKKWLKK